MVSGNLGGLKPIAGADKALPPPDAHDNLADLLDIKDAVPSSVNPGQNLINSMLRMQAVKSPKSDKPSKRDYRKPPNPDAIEVRQAT